jgi:hypothetical protein
LKNSRKLANIFAAMTLIMSALPVHAASAAWNPRTPLKYPESMVSMLLSSEPNAVNRSISAACIVAVKKVMQSGGNLVSKKLVANSLPLEKFPRSDVADNSFFHYTRSDSAFDQIAAKRSYADLFSYARTQGSSTWNWVFYVAADDVSSSGFGPYEYKFTLKPSTLIFYSQGDRPGQKSAAATVESEITKELIAKYPALSDCNHTFNDGPLLNFLVYLSAEASKIGAIAYWGVGNSTKQTTVPQSVVGVQWLQIVDAWSIQSMERIR